jgi:hypothetical protein
VFVSIAIVLQDILGKRREIDREQAAREIEKRKQAQLRSDPIKREIALRAHG